MTHPCEAQAARSLTALRAAPRPLHAEPGKPIVPDFYAAWDAQRAKVSFEILDDPGALLSVRVAVEGEPRWLSLNLVLGTAGFAAGEVLGLAAVAQADRDLVIAPYLRSGTGKAIQDTPLAESIEVGTGFAGRVALHGFGPGDPLVSLPLFHTLILPLPRQSFALVIKDLRFFVLGGDPSLLPGLPDLGSFAL